MNILSMLEHWTPEDFKRGKEIARKQGYGDSFCFLTSSHIPGLYLLPRAKGQADKVIVKTSEMGFVVIEVCES